MILAVNEAPVTLSSRPLAAAAVNALLLAPSSYNSTQGVLSVSSVPAGRIYSYVITDGGAEVTGLVCSSLPENVRVSSPMIHVDLGLQASAGALELNCADDQGSFGFRIGFAASSVAVVSSKLDLVDAGGPRQITTFSVSPDGSQLAWISSTLTTNAQAYTRSLASPRGAIASLTADSSAIFNSSSSQVAVSDSGRIVAITSWASNLGLGTGSQQVYAKDTSTGAVSLISSSDGTSVNRGNASSGMVTVSADGRYVVFESSATNLVAGTTLQQIFRKDRQTGALALVSSTDGTVANRGDAASSMPSISADGRYVVFASASTNLVAGSTLSQIFRKDMDTGSIVLVSSTNGAVGNRGDAASTNPHVSADGRYVVFVSASTNLVAGSTLAQVYRKDIQANTIAMVSSTDGAVGNRGNAASSYPRISGNGRYVSFLSTATNLVAGTTLNQAFRKDMQSQAIVLVSSVDGTAAQRASSALISVNPEISADGDQVFFVSAAANLLSGLHQPVVLRKTISTGAIDLVSTTGLGAAHYASDSNDAPEMTPDGRYVVFWTYAQNLVPGIVGSQIVRKDSQTGVIELVSSVDGTVATQGNASSAYPDISADGRYVVFESTATNLMAGATATKQIYRKDMQTGAITLVSSLDGTVAQRGNNLSRYAQITPDGQFVVFESAATNLVAGTTLRQILRKDLVSQAIELVSSPDGLVANQSNTDCDAPQITSDGRYVVFQSTANNLVAGSSGWQIYRRDMTGNAIALASSTDGTGANRGDASSYYTSISDDGVYVAFYSDADNLVPGVTGGIFRKNMVTQAIDIVSSPDGINGATGSNDYPELSSTGRYVLWQAAGTNMLAGLNGGQHVVRKDMQTGAVYLVTSLDGTVATQGSAGVLYGEMSPDGSLAVIGTGAAQGLINGVVGNSYQIMLKAMPTN